MKEIRRLLVLQHLDIEGPGLFEQFAIERDLKIEIIRLDNKNDLVSIFNEICNENDIVLVKGSRGMKMEKILNIFKI